MHGQFDFHLQFSTDAAAVGVGDAVPDERAGRVPVEPFRVSYAGFNCGRNCTMSGNTGSVEVIE